jgi:hypothetical protein
MDAFNPELITHTLDLISVSRCRWLFVCQHHQHAVTGGRTMIHHPVLLYPEASPTGSAAGHHDGGNARQRVRLPSMPHVRTFLRLLTGNSRMNTTVARAFPAFTGIRRSPEQPETGGRGAGCTDCQPRECCPLPLPVDVQAELFPEVLHARTDAG